MIIMYGCFLWKSRHDGTTSQRRLYDKRTLRWKSGIFQSWRSQLGKAQLTDSTDIANKTHAEGDINVNIQRKKSINYGGFFRHWVCLI